MKYLKGLIILAIVIALVLSFVKIVYILFEPDSDFVVKNQKLCDELSAKGCFNMGLAYYDGHMSIFSDKEKALDFFMRSCFSFEGSEESVNACYNSGSMLTSGDGVEKNMILGIKAYTNACMRGNSSACFNLAIIFRTDKEFLDKKEALRLNEKACAKDHTEGCYMSANMHFNADGKVLKKSYKKSIKYYLKSCDLGNGRGCLNAGVSYLKGFGVGPDFKKAISLFDKSCDLGVDKGCFNADLVRKNTN